MPDPDYKEILLGLIASLTLCDHMGDVSNDVQVALDRIGMGDIQWDEWSELGTELGKRGIKTLYGTELTGKQRAVMTDGILLDGDHDPRWNYTKGCGCRMCVRHEQIEADKKSNYRSIGDWVRRGFRDARGILIKPKN